MDSSRVKDNRFLPPFVARYVRIQPADFKLRAALRLELMGCDLNSEVYLQSEGYCFIAEKIHFVCVECFLFCFCPIGCSLPLGLQRGSIPADNFDASSHYSYMFRSWLPELARLNQGGSVNAWRPMVKANTEPTFSLSLSVCLSSSCIWLPCQQGHIRISWLCIWMSVKCLTWYQPTVHNEPVTQVHLN